MRKPQKLGKPLTKITDWFKELQKPRRDLIIFLGIVCLLVLVIVMSFIIIGDYSRYISLDDCDIQIRNAKRQVIADYTGDKLLAIFSLYYPLFLILAIGAAIGWALHGVGFKII